MNWLAGFKRLTHIVAGVGAVAVGWAVSDQGQGIIGGIVKAYPKASFVTGVIAFLAILYHSPKQ